MLARQVRFPEESSLATFVPLYAKYRVVPEGVTAQPPVTATPPEVPVVFWFSVGNVQFVRVPEDGVPRAGVTSVGEVERTTEPEPVEVVTPVPPEATARVVDNPAAVPVVF